LEALPTGITHVGTYVISLSVSDTLATPITTMFTISVPNTPPAFVGTIPDLKVPLNNLKTLDLS
jgi:hypothetical protein